MASKATKKIDGDVLHIDFSDGQSIAADLNQLPQEIVHHCAMHGLAQKLGDSYSGTPDVSESFTKCEAVYKSLLEGNWTTRVAGSGTPRMTQLIEALMNVTGQSQEDVTQRVELMDEDQKKDLRAHTQIKAAIEKIKARQAAEKAEKAAQALQASGEQAPFEF